MDEGSFAVDTDAVTTGIVTIAVTINNSRGYQSLSPIKIVAVTNHDNHS